LARQIRHKYNVVDFKYLRVEIDNDTNIFEGHSRTLNSPLRENSKGKEV